MTLYYVLLILTCDTKA